MAEELTKAVTLSLTELEEQNLIKVSKEFFGQSNKSGMVRYWITQALKNAQK